MWKILPIVAVCVAVVVGLLPYLLQSGVVEKEEVTGILHQGDPNYEWYEKYVTLKKPRVKMGKNYAGNRMVLFSGLVENNGEKTLDVVEVKLTFFNADVPVWESTRIPVRPGPGTYTPPLEPLSRRGFTLYLENVPENWRASNAEMSIQGFRFKSP